MAFWFCFCIISFFLSTILWLTFRNNPSKSRPPGPPGWPIIGNLLDIGMMPHQNLQKLGSKYGPIILVKLGMSNTLVIQSAKAAEELFKKHDASFSDRTVPDSFTACNYNEGSLIIARYGEYWRNIRKLSSSELFDHKRITNSASARKACIDSMIQWIKESSDESLANGGSGEIQFDKYLSRMTFNLISNFVLSKDILDSKSEKSNEFYEVMNEFMEWSGYPNVADALPFLKWIDPQGIRRNTEKHLLQLIDIVDGFVKERIEENLSGKERKNKDFLDSLLEFSANGEIDELSHKKIIIIVLEMYLAGTETTSTTIIWGMAELLRNPKKLAKLKQELDQIIGHSKNVEESDLNNLPYLQAVVKEVMRLHPSLPLLVPRKSTQHTEFMGYHIPKDTSVLVNVWAIQRDANLWEAPLSFKPERFIDSKIDFKGQNFELIPFGSGRRSCIGMILGDKMVSLTMAKLIHSLDWKLLVDVFPDTLDMREKTGISLRKLVPLVAIPS